MSARFLGTNCISRRFVLLFGGRHKLGGGRHKLGERFVSHGRFTEIPYTPFAPKFKPRPRIVPYYSDPNASFLHDEGPGKVLFIFAFVLCMSFIREVMNYKADQRRINRQKIKYKRLDISPYPYREKHEA